METEHLSNLIRDLVARMGLVIDDLTVATVAGHTIFTIVTRDSGALIGARGETLHALNHLIKKVFEEKTANTNDETFRFIVDVNGYHLKHIKSLEIQALMLAERARTFKYDIEMSPMSPYDRLIVHTVLQGAPDVATESQGEGALRRVVIKYKNSGEQGTS